MKTIVLTLFLLAGILQAEAQISMLPKNPGYQLRLPPDTNRNKLFLKPGIDSLAWLKKLVKQSPATQIVYGASMPVAKLRNSDPKMPIVQTDRTGYNMPVMGMSLPRVYNMKKPDTTTKPWP